MSGFYEVTIYRESEDGDVAIPVSVEMYSGTEDGRTYHEIESFAPNDPTVVLTKEEELLVKEKAFWLVDGG